MNTAYRTANPRNTLTQGQATALDSITHRIATRQPWVILSAGAGHGKSLIAQRLARRVRGATVLNASELTPERLIEQLRAVIGVTGVLGDAADPLAAVIRVLSVPNKRRRLARRMIIDNAERLDDTVLLQLQRLATLQPKDSAQVCFVLIGTPLIERRLAAMTGNKPDVLGIAPMRLSETRALCIGIVRGRRKRARLPSAATTLTLHLLARGNPARASALLARARAAARDGASVQFSNLLRAALYIPGAATLRDVLGRLQTLAKALPQSMPSRPASRQLRWACAAASVALGLIIAHTDSSWVLQNAQATASIARGAAQTSMTAPAAESPRMAADNGHSSIANDPQRRAGQSAMEPDGRWLPEAEFRHTPDIRPRQWRPVAYRTLPAGPTAQAPTAAPAQLPAATSRSPGAASPTHFAAPSPALESKVEKKARQPRDDTVLAGEAIAIGRISEAIAHLRRAIAAEPQNHAAHANLIALLGDRAKDAQWLEALSQAAQAMPAHFALAALQAHIELNRLEEADLLLERLPAETRDARLHAAAGLLHSRMAQPSRALQSYDAALVLTPPDSTRRHPLLLARAVVLEHLGRTEEARKVYRDTIDDQAAAPSLAFARARLASLASAEPAQ